MKHYQEPESLSSLRVGLFILSSIVFCFFVGFAYGVMCTPTNIILFIVLLTIGFGLFLGVGVRILAKLFSITKKKVVVYASLMTGVLGVYFSWVAYLLFFLSDSPLVEAYFSNPILVFRPDAVFSIMAAINADGLWEFGSATLHGWPLTLIWIAEALIVIFITFGIVYFQPHTPYSTTYSKWYRKYKLRRDFKAIGLKDEFRKRLGKDVIGTIDGLENGKAFFHSTISIFYLDKAQEQYLTVENVRKDRNGKNERSTAIVHLLEITKEEAKALMENYTAKKAFFFDY